MRIGEEVLDVGRLRGCGFGDTAGDAALLQYGGSDGI